MVNTWYDGWSDGNAEGCTNDKAGLLVDGDGKELRQLLADNNHMPITPPTEEDEHTIDDFYPSVDVVAYPNTTTGCSLSSSIMGNPVGSFGYLLDLTELDEKEGMYTVLQQVLEEECEFWHCLRNSYWLCRLVFFLFC